MTAAAPRTITLLVRGPIERADLPALAQRVYALFTDNRGSVVYCDVIDVRPDAVAVDALTRLQLIARRSDCRVVLRRASDELRELVDLMGLTDVVSRQP